MSKYNPYELTDTCEEFGEISHLPVEYYGSDEIPTRKPTRPVKMSKCFTRVKSITGTNSKEAVLPNETALIPLDVACTLLDASPFFGPQSQLTHRNPKCGNILSIPQEAELPSETACIPLEVACALLDASPPLPPKPVPRRVLMHTSPSSVHSRTHFRPSVPAPSRAAILLDMAEIPLSKRVKNSGKAADIKRLGQKKITTKSKFIHPRSSSLKERKG